MGILNDYLDYLNDIGFYDVALPFFLVFTIIYAILQKVAIFGSDIKASRFNAVIAFAFALLVVNSAPVVEVMNEFLPSISLMAVVIISLLLLLGILTGTSPAKFSGLFGGIMVALVIVGVVFAFFSSSGALGLELPAWLDMSQIDFNLLLAIGISFLVITYLTSTPRSEGGQGGPGFKKFFQDLANLGGDSSGKK